MIKPGQNFTKGFETSHPTSFNVVDADSLPVGVLVINGNDTANDVNVIHKSTGSYLATFVIPSDLIEGDVAELRIEVVVDGVSAKETIWSDTIASCPAPTPSPVDTTSACNDGTPVFENEESNPNLLPEDETPGRQYDCNVGPRFHREKIRSQIADYCIMMLGGPVIEIELDKQQISLAVNEGLKLLEEWAPSQFFKWYTFRTVAHQSVYEMPCQIGYIRSIEYMSPTCDGATELGGAMPLGWVGDTGYGAGGLSWGAWGYNRNQPYWGYAGEWAVFKSYENMFERVSSRNGGWEFYEDLHKIKIYPTPYGNGGTVSVHYMEKKTDFKEATQFMQEYALALCKVMLGRIRGKYSSIVSAGDGVSLDAAQLLQEGNEEKKQLERDLVYKFADPVPIVMG